MNTETVAESGAVHHAPGYTELYRRYVLCMLIAVSVLNYVDRQILAILLEPIKGEFSLTDTELGFLSGIAFALFYSVMGIPLARIADRGNRRNLIAIVIALWSGMTALCGMAIGFGTLLLARIGVAVGEAGAFPPSASIVADLFEPSRRATMLGIHSIGVYIGILLGFLLGGWINEYFGWRTAFIVVGLPGLLFALLFFLSVREPQRGHLEGFAPEQPPGLADTFRYLWSKCSYRYLPFGAGFFAFTAYGSMTWAPSYFIRSHGMTTGEIGSWLALTVGLAGGLAVYLGGVTTDRLIKATGDRRWYAWLPAASGLMSIPFVLGMYLYPTKEIALVISIGAWFFSNTWLGPTIASLHGVASPHMRALAVAIMMFVNNLLGIGLGPQAVGIVSDLLNPVFGVDALRYALLICLIPATVISAGFFIAAARHLNDDLHADKPPN